MLFTEFAMMAKSFASSILIHIYFCPSQTPSNSPLPTFCFSAEMLALGYARLPHQNKFTSSLPSVLKLGVSLTSFFYLKITRKHFYFSHLFFVLNFLSETLSGGLRYHRL